jgi:RNA polymerase sigma-70 factor (ECF subfamily)
VAETFTVAWRRIADVPSGQDARAWLYGVARRVLANHDRAIRRRLDERLAADVAVHSVNDVSEDEGADREGRGRKGKIVITV